MADRAQALNTALNLMRHALELLDTFGERETGIHLQHAIDTLTDAPVARSVDEAEAMLDSPESQEIQKRLGWIA